MENMQNDEQKQEKCGCGCGCGCKTDNPFFNFIKPYLGMINNGSLFRKPISGIYSLIAVLHLVMPFVLIYKIYEYWGMFQYMSWNVIIAFIFLFIITLAMIWVGFLIWWDRRGKVLCTSSEEDDFVATPILAHFAQTVGEWAGTIIGVGGFWVTLVAMIFGAGSEIPYLTYGWLGLVFFPLYGFFIIISARFMAEMLKAVVSIANNTKHK